MHDARHLSPFRINIKIRGKDECGAEAAALNRVSSVECGARQGSRGTGPAVASQGVASQTIVWISTMYVDM